MEMNQGSSNRNVESNQQMMMYEPDQIQGQNLNQQLPTRQRLTNQKSSLDLEEDDDFLIDP